MPPRVVVTESARSLEATHAPVDITHAVSAAAGFPEAFGEDASFAITSIFEILRQSAGGAAEGIDALRYQNDIGTRGAVAEAIPHDLLPELAEFLTAAGATHDDVAAAAATVGPLAATATCLKFARGYDTVWTHPCEGAHVSI